MMESGLQLGHYYEMLALLRKGGMGGPMRNTRSGAALFLLVFLFPFSAWCQDRGSLISCNVSVSVDRSDDQGCAPFDVTCIHIGTGVEKESGDASLASHQRRPLIICCIWVGTRF